MQGFLKSYEELCRLSCCSPDNEEFGQVNRCVFMYIVLKNAIFGIGPMWYDQVLTKNLYSQKKIYTSVGRMFYPIK